MKLLKSRNIGISFIFIFSLLSCEDYLEVDAPDHKIVSEAVFNNDETAQSAMQGIYHYLFQAAYSGGYENSVTVLAGLSADELECIRDNNLTLLEFEKNEILPSNNRNFSLWSSAYNIIYMCNSLLEGIENSGSLSDSVRSSLEGEAKFVRAFSYFYLVNLYGDVPLILTTDYRSNARAERIDEGEIYDQIQLDLTDATTLLESQYRDGDRSRANLFAAVALNARVNLYLENWQEAENLSNQVLNGDNLYELSEDLSKTFLANSNEAIWQVSPMGGGGVFTNTNEGLVFLFHPFFPSMTKIRLTEDLVNSFQEADRRFQNWIGFNEKTSSYFSFKYKDNSSMGNITEYSMVLRFAEQYLIRAEARAMQNNLTGAIADINKIRNRAGLPLISETNPGMSKDQVLELILEERRKELFTEWGHRWLDLKRTGKASEVLSDNPFWENTDVFYPIPEEELQKNSNLAQNPGY